MLRFFTKARAAPLLFSLALLAGYVMVPVFLHVTGNPHPSFVQLATLCLVASIAVGAGALLPVPLHRFSKVAMRPELFLLAVWGAFLGFVLVACVTAERIPLVASLQGADANTIAVLRERFLKAREGWQASFVYI